MRFWQCTAHSEKRRKYAFSANTRSETYCFRRKRGVKRCVFGDNTVFKKIQLWGKLLYSIFFKLWKSGRQSSLLLNETKKCEKRTIKSRACVPFRKIYYEMSYSTYLFSIDLSNIHGVLQDEEEPTTTTTTHSPGSIVPGTTNHLAMGSGWLIGWDVRVLLGSNSVFRQHAANASSKDVTAPTEENILVQKKKTKTPRMYVDSKNIGPRRE